MLFAARRLLADPVAIVVAIRAGEESPLADAGLPALDLLGLDLGASEQLLAAELAGLVPEGSAERLFRATGGNPLALIELAGEAESVAGSLVEGPLPIATTVERAFAGRVSRLSVHGAALTAPHRRLVHDRSRGARARRRDLLDIDIGALQEAEAAGLVAVDDGSRPLPASARPLGRAQRRRAGRAPRGARRPGADAERRAVRRRASLAPRPRRVRTRRHGRRRALQRGRRGRASAVRTPRPRVTAERAARLTPAGPERGRRLLEAASNAWIAGSGEHAVSLLDEAAQLAVERRPWRSRAPTCAGTSSSHAATRCRPARSSSRAARLAVHDERRAALLWAEASYASFCAGRGDAMLEDARAACAVLARARRRPRGLHRAAGARHGAGVQRRRRRGPARPCARPSGWSPTDDCWTGRRCSGGGRSRRRSSCARRARRAKSFMRVLASARDKGVAGALSPLRPSATRATPRRPIAGPRREPRYYEAAELAHHTGQPGEECAAFSGLAWLEAREGREESCRAHAADALALAREYGRGFYEAWALAALGDLELALGRPAEAVERLSDMQATLDRLGIADVDLSPAPELAEALVHCGRGEDAVAVSDDYRRRAAAKGQPWALARAARRRGPGRERRRVPCLVRAGAALARVDARHVRARAQRAGLRRAAAPRAPAPRRARASARGVHGLPPSSEPSRGRSARGSSSPRRARRRASAIRARSTSSRRASCRSRSTSPRD